MSWLTEQELTEIGFASCGSNVRISSKASIYNPSAIHIGDNVRIDDFTVLSAGEGGIYIGSYIHIAVFSSFLGVGKIELEDYANISSRVSIYSSNDDYTGISLTGPTIGSRFTGVTTKPVLLRKHAIVGSGSVILPGVTLGSGVECFLTIGGELRDGDCRQDTDDRNNDQQLDQGKTLLVLAEFLEHGHSPFKVNRFCC